MTSSDLPHEMSLGARRPVKEDAPCATLEGRGDDVVHYVRPDRRDLVDLQHVPSTTRQHPLRQELRDFASRRRPVIRRRYRQRLLVPFCCSGAFRLLVRRDARCVSVRFDLAASPPRRSVRVPPDALDAAVAQLDKGIVQVPSHPSVLERGCLTDLVTELGEASQCREDLAFGRGRVADDVAAEG